MLYRTLKTSVNKHYFIGANKYQETNQIEITVFDITNFCLLYKFNARGEFFYPSRIAISDNGETVATALWEEKMGSIYVYRHGNLLHELSGYNHIDWIEFYDNTNLIVGRHNKTVIINLDDTNANIVTQNCYKIIHNNFGEDIIQKKDNLVLNNKIQIKASTFSYLSIIGIEGGTVLSEANNCAICYDANGTKMWESDTKQYGHILDMLYSQEMKEIYCISWNPLDAEVRHFICLNSNDGTVKNVIDVEHGVSRAFLMDYSKPYMVDGNGICYSIEDSKLIPIHSLVKNR